VSLGQILLLLAQTHVTSFSLKKLYTVEGREVCQGAGCTNRCSKDSSCAHKGLVTNWPQPQYVACVRFKLATHHLHSSPVFMANLQWSPWIFFSSCMNNRPKPSDLKQRDRFRELHLHVIEIRHKSNLNLAMALPSVQRGKE
jgi:hypothetical protein